MGKKVKDIDLSEVLRSPQGRNLLMRYIELFGYFDDTFDDNPITAAKRAGLRTAAIQIVQEIEHRFPDQWVLMTRERLDKRHEQTETTDEDEHDDN